ncbi:MAG TPA: ABC transporter permease [Terriglobales bacterium]|nr:ABC transporter permease [Terriglobales bacterium]
MSGLLQDLRYALRQSVKNPTFTLVAVVTLALAIGANTAIFSVISRVLLTPLPYPHPDRLAMIWGSNPSRGDKAFPISPGDFADWKSRNDVFEDIAASFDHEVTLTGRGDPKMVLGYNFTPSYFKILGVAPKLGRTFTEDEARSEANLVVLSDKFWRTTFHADTQVAGKSLTLDAKVYTVIGVMPADFDYPPRTELWMPLQLSPAGVTDYEHRFIHVMGRLKPGVSPEEAQTRMNALQQQIASQHPQTDAGNETWVEPLRNELVGGIRAPLLALFGAVGFVLLIACANIAGLVLARAASRKGELSVRLAIGASRLRVLQQYLAEGLVIAALGGTLGVLLALWSTRFLVAIFPNNIANLSIPKVESIPMSAPVLWFTLVITVLTALLFSAVPALQSFRINAREAMKDSGRNVASGVQAARARRILVTSEIALSVVLLAGAGVMVESFRNAYHQDLGFRTDDVLGLEVFLPSNRYPSEQPLKRTAFVDGVLDNLEKIPGVKSAAAINFLPLTGFWGTTDFTIEGRIYQGEADKPQADNRLITPGYFSTMGIALLRGRDFADSDRAGSEKVAIVNATLAQRYFGGDDPIGKSVEVSDGSDRQRCVIVGVASDVRAFGPEQEAHADLYRALSQVTFPLLAFTVRTTGNPSSVLNMAKQAVWNIDKDQPVFDAMPMSLLGTQSVALRRVSATLLGSFAGLGLLLAAVGLYGLLAYSVTQRTHEIGIRMALGAQHGDVLRQMLRSGMRLVLLGELVGLVVAVIVIRAGSSLLYEVKPGDPTVLIVAAGLLLAAAVTATYFPARRATKVDPMVALRYE